MTLSQCHNDDIALTAHLRQADAGQHEGHRVLPSHHALALGPDDDDDYDDDDDDDDDDDGDISNYLMMTELLLRLRAGLPVSELPRRRHSAMIEQNVRIWSHRAELSNIRFESGQRQIIQFSVSSPRGRRMPSRR